MQPAIVPLNIGIFRVLPAFSLSSSAEYYPKSAALERTAIAIMNAPLSEAKGGLTPSLALQNSW
ncbi:hypothetical protein [Scytonema sp. PCC 10023]|uniref:hypothetical protein n=1 Tax=Scytonema sp. PCC 10023 TaxID=1680591 RepID=UPI0039C6E7B5